MKRGCPKYKFEREWNTMSGNEYIIFGNIYGGSTKCCQRRQKWQPQSRKTVGIQSQSSSTCTVPCVAWSRHFSSLSFSCLTSNTWVMDWLPPKGPPALLTLSAFMSIWGLLPYRVRGGKGKIQSLGQTDLRRALKKWTFAFMKIMICLKEVTPVCLFSVNFY